MNSLQTYTYEELKQVFAQETSARRSSTESVVNQETQLIHLDEYRPASWQAQKPDYAMIRRQCGFLSYCEQHAHELPEPYWFPEGSIVLRCVNGPELFHEISSSYPGYSYRETDRKIQHLLKGPGPHTCVKINDISGGEICPSCEHWGRIKSPIQLGYDKADDPLQQAVVKFNEKYAVVMFGGKCLVIREERNGDITFMTKTDFLNYCSNKTVSTYGPRGSKRIKTANYWFDSEDRREYPEVRFSPNCEPGDYYNLYRGLAVEAIQGDWSLMRQHIFEVIASGNQKTFDYVLAWLARIVQQPGGRRPGVALVLRSGQGTGKGIFVSNFGAIFGIHHVQIFNQEQLTGKFNTHLARSIFVFCDEGIWAGDKTAEGVLKGMVTESYLMMEPKGKDAVKIENHVNLVIASNNSWVTPAGIDERRFCVLDVSDKYQQDTKHFTAIQNQMDSGGREAMLYDLLKMDISQVDLRDFPRTEALLDQVVYSLDSVGKYWHEILRDGCFSNEWDGHPIDGSEWPNRIPIQVVYEQYLAFCKSQNIRYPVAKSQFGKKLVEYSPGIVRARESNVEGRRIWCYEFKDIASTRNDFANSVNIKIKWEE